MLEKDAQRLKKQNPQKKPTQKETIDTLKTRIFELETALEELRQSPTIPTQEWLSEYLKAHQEMIPQFLLPQIPIPQQLAIYRQTEEKLRMIEKQTAEAQKGLNRLKKGIRTPPMGV